MRTARIVGPQQRVDERDTPHPRMRRGELGQRLQRLRTTPSSDPFRRIVRANSATDRRNCLTWVLGNTADGAVNPKRVEVPDPAAMSSRIKEVARFFGADVVGIAPLDQAYVYSHRDGGSAARGEKDGEEVNLPHRFAICLGTAGDYNKYRANPSRISDAEYSVGSGLTCVVAFQLAAYIREMGYPAVAHDSGHNDVNPIPLAVMAGLGELGRNGLLINDEYGPGLHLFVVTTDLPLAVDHPVDIAVEDFCQQCKKCARLCPSRSIPFGDKVVYNGVEKWLVNVDSCYRLRAFQHDQCEVCLTCIVTCCYYKRDTWWHTLALRLVLSTPIPLRPAFVKPLLWLDDLIWGKEPHRHVKWLDYDSAYTPPIRPCKVPGCAVHSPGWKAGKGRGRVKQVVTQPK
ncbi:MAG: hypothetical protein HYY01_11745 [Chloroflexi bacterium]|nr:hypothetical protein [Chloroflexota bacterium]